MFDDATNGGLTVGQRIGRLEAIVSGRDGHEARINTLEGWRDEVRGVSLAVKAIFGVSLLNALGVMVSIYLVVSGHR